MGIPSIGMVEGEKAREFMHQDNGVNRRPTGSHVSRDDCDMIWCKLDAVQRSHRSFAIYL